MHCTRESPAGLSVSAQFFVFIRICALITRESGTSPAGGSETSGAAWASHPSWVRLLTASRDLPEAENIADSPIPWGGDQDCAFIPVEMLLPFRSLRYVSKPSQGVVGEDHYIDPRITKKSVIGGYRAGMMSERSPAGMNSRIAPRANSRLGSAKSNLSAGSAKQILILGSYVQASPRPK